MTNHPVVSSKCIHQFSSVTGRLPISFLEPVIYHFTLLFNIDHVTCISNIFPDSLTSQYFRICLFYSSDPSCRMSVFSCFHIITFVTCIHLYISPIPDPLTCLCSPMMTVPTTPMRYTLCSVSLSTAMVHKRRWFCPGV